MTEIYKDLRSLQSKQQSLNELEVVHEVQAIRNSIKNILTTRIGSVPGKPNFGSNLHLLVFSQLDAITARLAERYTREAIAKYEDRIAITNIEVQKDDAFNRLVINIYFRFIDNIGRTQTDSAAVSFNI